MNKLRRWITGKHLDAADELLRAGVLLVLGLMVLWAALTAIGLRLAGIL